MGADCLKEEIRLPGRDFKWPESKVKALGAWFFLHPKETLTLNNQEKFLKVQNILSSWSFRRLSLISLMSH